MYSEPYDDGLVQQATLTQTFESRNRMLNTVRTLCGEYNNFAPCSTTANALPAWQHIPNVGDVPFIEPKEWNHMNAMAVGLAPRSWPAWATHQNRAQTGGILYQFADTCGI